MCMKETHNTQERYAIAVKKSQTVVGHLPQKISRVCSLFLCRGDMIECTVTGKQRYSVDLPQGGLEIPCSLLFKATHQELAKLKKFL